MDGTYFVGKSELLNWINTTLDLNFTKIEQVPMVSLTKLNSEPGAAGSQLPVLMTLNSADAVQTASGAVACQLLDALHPGSINLAKVGSELRGGLQTAHVSSLH